MARPRFHILVTAPFAALAYRRLGPLGALGLAAGGVLVDLDHLADYFWVRHHKERQHFLAPLHAWELVAAGGALLLWAAAMPSGPPRRASPSSRRTPPFCPPPGAPRRRRSWQDCWPGWRCTWCRT